MKVTDLRDYVVRKSPKNWQFYPQAGAAGFFLWDMADTLMCKALVKVEEPSGEIEVNMAFPVGCSPRRAREVIREAKKTVNEIIRKRVAQLKERSRIIV